jgi:hypothetical protein
MRTKLAAAIFAATVGTLAATSAQVVVYTFSCITNNSATDCGIGQAQLSMDVTAYNSGVLFEISNAGPLQSTIEQVFFDDGVLQGTTKQVFNPAGIDFTLDGNPGNLPGGNSIVPQFVTSFSFSAEPPPTGNGVNPGEEVGFWFYKSGLTLNSVLADLNDGDLRVGLHVINYASRGSESFVSTPAIPEPGTFGLLAAGLLGMLGVARRPKL